MPVNRRKAAVLGGALILRLLLLLLFPSLPDLLTGRVEVSTPVTSFKRLQEGLFLYNRNVSPYDGGLFHQAPLLLPIFSLLPNAQEYPFPTALFYSLLDLLNANALITISDSAQAVSGRLYASIRKEITWDGAVIAAWFLFNPFTIATCLGRSTAVFTSTGILYALSAAVQGQSLNSMLALGLASYLSIYPALLFIPLVLLCYDRQAQRSNTTPSTALFVVKHFAVFLLSVAGLLGVSLLIVGDFARLVSATYGFHLLVPDLTPNIGLWWYFFIEIFDSFRDFFLGVFWLHLTAYAGSLTVRLRRQPLFVITSLLGIFAVFKPYPSIADASLYFALLPLYRHIFPCEDSFIHDSFPNTVSGSLILLVMRYTFFSVSALLYASLLGPAFYHLWIYAGSGNANFFYAITLVWSLGLSLIIADTIFAALRDEWELENPEKRGKTVKQV